MKKLIVLAILMMSGSVYGADMSKLGFRAYSSASSKTCMVFGMGDRLRSDGYYKAAIQGFSPDTTYSRSYLLGTKGFGNYSTTGYTGNINLTAVKFTCTVTGTDTAAPVKVYLNSVETYYLTTDSDTFVVGR